MIEPLGSGHMHVELEIVMAVKEPGIVMTLEIISGNGVRGYRKLSVWAWYVWEKVVGETSLDGIDFSFYILSVVSEIFVYT